MHDRSRKKQFFHHSPNTSQLKCSRVEKLPDLMGDAGESHFLRTIQRKTKPAHPSLLPSDRKQLRAENQEKKDRKERKMASLTLYH
jgi:hypothetical protein